MNTLFSKLLISILTIVCLSLGFSNACFAESALDRIKQQGYINAGIKISAGPFASQNANGDIIGFEIDILNYIVEKLGVELKIIPVTNASRIVAIESGQVDLAFATMTHTSGRDKVIDYSITYFYDGQKLLVKKDSEIQNYEDLAGKNVGATKGTTGVQNIRNVQPNAKVVLFDKHSDGIVALQNDIIDAMTTDSTVLLGLKVGMDNSEDYAIVGDFFSDEPYGIGLPQNDSKWRDFVNECLIEMWNSGEWKKAYNKWFGPGKKYEFPLDFTMSTWPLR